MREKSQQLIKDVKTLFGEDRVVTQCLFDETIDYLTVLEARRYNEEYIISSEDVQMIKETIAQKIRWAMRELDIMVLAEDDQASMTKEERLHFELENEYREFYGKPLLEAPENNCIH